MQMLAKIIRKPIIATLISVFFGFVVVALILLCSGYNVADVLSMFFIGTLGRPEYISEVLIKSAPLIIVAIGVSIAFKVGLCNLGAEGQYIAGCLTATLVGSAIDLPAVLQIPIVILSAMAGGAVCGWIEGVLKAKRGINEIVSGIMVNWSILYLNNFLSFSVNKVNKSSYITILDDWKKSPQGLATLDGMPVIKDFLLKPDVNAGFLIAVVVALLISFFFKHAKAGYEYRAAGLGKFSAEFTGINYKSKIIRSMIFGGAVCGLGGAIVIMGTSPHGISALGAFQNNGFNGMSVAFIANSSPIGCIFIGLLFGMLFCGGQAVQAYSYVPTDIVNIMIGVMVFFMALTVAVPMVADKLGRSRKNG